MNEKFNNVNKNTKIRLYLSMFLIAYLIGMLVYMSSANKNEKTYNEFWKDVKSKSIQEVIIDFSENKFKVETKDGIYTVDNPKYDNFKKELLESEVKVTEINNSKKMNIMFNVLELSFMGFMIIQLFKMFNSQSKTNSEVINPKMNKIQTTFKDVAGLQQVKDDLQLLVTFLKDKDKFQEAGAKMPKGVILAGPPGTGKTLLAKAIAGEAEVPFFSVSGSDFIEMFVGVGAKRVRELFKDAKKNAPCIIFIDEIDAIGGKRDTLNNNSEQRQTINALLSEMDGFSGSEGVLVIAATNRINDLDPALIRPGRFDKHITVPLPETPEERMEVIKIYAENKKFAEDVDFNILSRETIGFSPADIEALLNEAALISVQKDKNFIDKSCIDDAIYKKLLRGHAKQDKTRDEEELKLVAWHEAGHATIAKIYDMDVTKVTIIKSTSGAGGVNIIVPKKMGLYSIEELKNQIKMGYGGRCAEKLLYGDLEKITTGASADIEQATSIIYQMITNYGMSDKYGMLNLENLSIPNSKIMEEAIALSKELEAETDKLLEEYKDFHQEIVNRLLEKETIDGNELEEIYQKYKK